MQEIQQVYLDQVVKCFILEKDKVFTILEIQTKLGDLLLGGKEAGGFSKSKIAGIGVGVLSVEYNLLKHQKKQELLMLMQTGNSA